MSIRFIIYVCSRDSEEGGDEGGGRVVQWMPCHKMNDAPSTVPMQFQFPGVGG